MIVSSSGIISISNVNEKLISFYFQARNLGFKSVAHYLIQTRGAPLNQKGVGSVDSSQALANQPPERDDSLSSVR